MVRTPDGRIVVDPTGRLAGRGAYVCQQEACLAQAITTGALQRALHTSLPDELRVALVAGGTDQIFEGGARGQE